MPDLLPGLVLAEGAPAAPAAPAAPSQPSGDGGGSLLGSLAPLLIIFVIFYVLMIRPQSKERKKREAMVKALRKGDRVVTTAGIHGDVAALTENTVTVRVDDGVRITFDRAAVWQVKPRDEDAPAEDASREKSQA